MVRHKKTTYAILTPEHRFQLQEDIRLRGAALVAAGMPPDSPGPEEIGEVVEVEGDASELMQGVDPVGVYVIEEEEGGDEDDEDDEDGGDEDDEGDEEGVDEDDGDDEDGDDKDDEDDEEGVTWMTRTTRRG
nr:trigger factor-like [Aegilops tauschii subsp. strangulata]